MYGDGAPMIRNRQLVEAWSAGEDIIPFVVPDGVVISEQAEETRPSWPLMTLLLVAYQITQQQLNN